MDFDAGDNCPDDGTEHINFAEITSSKPFNGVNIVKTTYADGSVVISKVVR